MGDPERKLILVIDDDPDISEALSRILDREGYATVCAEDGEKGLEAVKAHGPDLIILDFMMPVKNGFDAACEIRNLTDAPIVALTAYGMDIGRNHGLASCDEAVPFAGFVEKPFEPNVLIKQVARAFG